MHWQHRLDRLWLALRVYHLSGYSIPARIYLAASYALRRA
jgi:hypothetical protein